jgi:tRNA (guanine-N7-)-methyltransferase
VNPTPTESEAPIRADAGNSAYPRNIRSFVRRAGRTTVGQTRALAEVGPRVLLPYSQTAIDLVAFHADFQRKNGQNDASNDASNATLNAGAHRPVVLEIGFGMGEATAHIAATLPGTDFLCCEVHEPGVGALLKRIDEQDLHNIRIIAHDAVEVIEHMLPAWSPAQPRQGLDGIHIFFPDPWHKKRHNKRRLIQPPFIAKLVTRLKPGGYLHCATDWQPYAEQMLQVLSGEPLLENTMQGDAGHSAGYASKPHYRPLTKFENRGIKLGHGVWDLVFRRRAA